MHTFIIEMQITKVLQKQQEEKRFGILELQNQLMKPSYAR